MAEQLSTVLKGLGKELIRDRKRRGLPNTASVDVVTLKLAATYFEDQKLLFDKRRERWLKLAQVKQLYDHVNRTRMVKHPETIVEKNELRKVCEFVKMSKESIDALFNLTTEANDVQWNTFVALALSLTAENIIDTINNAIQIISTSTEDDGVVSTEELISFLEYYATVDQPLSEAITTLKENCKMLQQEHGSFTTVGMIKSALKDLEDAARKVAQKETVNLEEKKDS